MARLNTTKAATTPEVGDSITRKDRHEGCKKPNTASPTKKGRRGAGVSTVPVPDRADKGTRNKGLSRFKIYEDSDEDELSEENNKANSAKCQRTSDASLKVSSSNIMPVSKSKRSKGGSDAMEGKSDSAKESEVDLDQEELEQGNPLLDNEAEEVSEEESQQSSEDGFDGHSNDQFGMARSFDAPRSMARRFTQLPDSSLSRYREAEYNTEEDEAGSRVESDNNEDSLDGFIVGDDEDISYHESMDGLVSSGEEQEDAFIKEPSPKPRRRRLIRGRRAGAVQQERQRTSPNIHQRSQSLHRESIKDGNVIPQERVTPVISLDDSDNEKNSRGEVPEECERTDSPRKEQPSKRNLQTPPDSPLNSALLSPSKSRYRIPKSPHRESSDDFWRQDVIMEWAENNSPWKKMRGLELESLAADFSDDSSNAILSPDAVASSVGTKSPSKTALKKAQAAQRREARAKREAFNLKKQSLARDFFETLDNAVTGGKVQELSKDTGGLKIVWSKTLSTTAGRCLWRSQITKLGSEPKTSRELLHHATIELAEKIIDCEDRLLRTFAHEYCHLTNYMISNVHDQPHGSSFQQWARKCEEAMKDHPLYGGKVVITTKHSYNIDFKYVWKCMNCSVEYGRHSKSIKPETARCGPCGGKLEQIKPPPRKSSPRKPPQKQPTPLVEDVISKMESISVAWSRGEGESGEACCEL